MALPLPYLDTRRFADLSDEGRALVPRHAPAWTDHNVHDPGITLVELLAWLVEQDIYRLNQVPDRHRRKFLRLIGFAPAPPRASQAFLSFAPDFGTLPFAVPVGAMFDALTPGDRPPAFRTRRDLSVARVSLAALQVEEGDPSSVRDRTAEYQDGLPIVVLGAGTEEAMALYLGFAEIPLGVPIALGFRVEGPGQDSGARARLLDERLLDREACRPVLPAIECGPPGPGAPAADEPLPHHSARLVWEVSTGPGPTDWSALAPVAGLARPQSGEVLDDTRALTLDGLVELSLPASATARALGSVATPLIYVRARRVAGQHDAAVALIGIAPNAVSAEEAAPVWQRFTIAAGVIPSGAAPAAGTATRLRFVLDERDVIQQLSFQSSGPDDPEVMVLEYAAPTVSTAGALSLELVLVGRGTGHPQRFDRLPQAPAVEGSVEVYTHDGVLWQAWTLRPDLDASTRADLHAALDPDASELEIGDGERGCVVPAGTLLLARYRATHAAAGNLAALAAIVPSASPRNLAWLATLPASVVDQLARIGRTHGPATGGAGAETVPEASARAVRLLHAPEQLLEAARAAGQDTLDQVDGRTVRDLASPTRGVNCLDLERIALDVPGTRVARARAWAGVHPAYPCLRAPGVVTVVIVPDQAGTEPTPSPELLETIRRFLHRRRLVSMRLEVVGPRYLAVDVHVRVATRPLASAARVETAIRWALHGFLDPRAGGPDGRGWPFGRDVYRTEILELIDRIPGVDHVLELTLGSEESGDPGCGNVRLCPTWLVRAGTIQVEVNPKPGTSAGDLAPCEAPGGHGPDG